MQNTPDVNLVSLNGPHSNGLSHTFGVIGKDNDPSTFDDALKITSNGCYMQITVEELFGGREDCLDINNHSGENRIVIKNATPRGKFFATIKGSSPTNYISAVLHAHGTEVDVDLGNNSKQSNEKTKAQVLDIKTTTGKPVRVRVLNAERPVLVDGSGPYEFVFPKPGFFHGFFILFFKLGCLLRIV